MLSQGNSVKLRLSAITSERFLNKIFHICTCVLLGGFGRMRPQEFFFENEALQDLL